MIFRILFYMFISIWYPHIFVCLFFSVHCKFSFLISSFSLFLCIFNFRAPLSVRVNNGSSGPGSEHSLPPSYNRTRNNLLRIPAIIGGNSNSVGNTSQPRNNDNNTSSTTNSIIETKLSKSSTTIQDIDELFLNANNSNGSHDTITTDSNAKSAEIENATNSESNVTKLTDDTKTAVVTTTMAATSTIGNDLVTIVTITGCTTTESSTGGEMNILAHL